MQREVCVTGIGVVSALGSNATQNLKCLIEGESGIAPLSILSSVHRGVFPVGEVKMTNDELRQELSLNTEQEKQFTRTALIGAMAAKEALINAGIDINDGKRTALVSSTTVGGMDKTENSLFQEDNDMTFVKSHLCGASTDAIADYLGLQDYTATLSTACSSGANAIMHGARLISNGMTDRAIVGGIDALSKFTVNGFNSLQILDEQWCRPFDETRAGLNIGEGAGFIVLEKCDDAEGREKCKLVGYANANDAFHQTASSPDGVGAYLAMQGALEMADVSPSEVDYINAHGTGTNSNDFTEGTAISRLFGENIPAFSSTKPFTGHTLGAAAGIEAVFSVLAIEHNLMFPSLNITTVMPELKTPPVTELVKDKEISVVLSNSFGFGGNSSALLFSK